MKTQVSLSPSQIVGIAAVIVTVVVPAIITIIGALKGFHTLWPG